MRAQRGVRIVRLSASIPGRRLIATKKERKNSFRVKLKWERMVSKEIDDIEKILSGSQPELT